MGVSGRGAGGGGLTGGLTAAHRSRHNLQASLQRFQDLGLGTLRMPPQQRIQSLQLAGWGSTRAMSGLPLLGDAGSGGGGSFLEGPGDEDPVDLFAVQRLALEQGARQYVELLEIGIEELAGAHRAVGHDTLDLGIDEDGGLFAVVLGPRDLAPEEDV